MAEAQIDPTEAKRAAELQWLTARPIGATVAEYIQQLHPDDANEVWAAITEADRLGVAEKQLLEQSTKISSWGTISAIAIFLLGMVPIGYLARKYPDWLVNLSLVLATAVPIAASKYVARAYWHRAWAHLRRRMEILETTFDKRGISFEEHASRLKSKASIRREQERASHGLAMCKMAWEEIRNGIAKAKDAGIDISDVKKDFYDNNPALSGRLTIDHIPDDPKIERFHKLMVSAGLRDHTIEAVLLRYRSSGTLPLSRQIFEVAAARIAATPR